MWEAMRLLIANKGLTGRAAGAFGVFVELIENLAARIHKHPNPSCCPAPAVRTRWTPTPSAVGNALLALVCPGSLSLFGQAQAYRLLSG